MFLIFDFDGTLGDTYAVFRQAFDQAAHSMNRTAYRREDEAHIRTLEASDVFRFHEIPPHQLGRFVELLREGMEERRTEVTVFDGIPRVLEALCRERHHLGLLSSNSLALVESTLGDQFAFFEYRAFDVSLSGKTAALREAATTYSAADSIFYIGDEIRDFKAAEAANIPFAAVTWGYNTESTLREAGCRTIIQSPWDLLDLKKR